jgi:hypothetical protein
MFDPGPYNHLTWQSIKDLLGIERIKKLLSGKQLVSFLNWSEIENSSTIWEGVIDEILPSIEHSGQKPYFFSDFSDCSRRSKTDIQNAIKLLGRFRNYFSVTLSLNQNEAELVSGALNVDPSLSDEEFVKLLFNACSVDTLVIHRTNDAIAYDGVSYEKCDTFFCDNPKILTGGGDNFNAGFCFGLLNDFSLNKSLIIANAVSGLYVEKGVSPVVHDLIEFLNLNCQI